VQSYKAELKICPRSYW